MKARPLTIAYVSDAIYPYNIGGKEKRIFEISTRLARKGHKVHVYCMKWWKEDLEQKQEDGVQLHAITKLYPLYWKNRRSIRQAIFFALGCFKLIRQDFDVLDVDHMPHLVLFPLKLVCLIKNKKMVVTWNEVWGRKYWLEYLGGLGVIAFVIEFLSAKMPDVLVAVSRHTKSRLQQTLKISKPIKVIPNGIDLQFIQKVKPSETNSTIIFAGRLLQNKHVDTLIHAVSQLKSKQNLLCLIIGNGPEKKKILSLIRSLNLKNQIKVLDFLPKQSQLYALMKSSRIFVLPSTREGFGIVALEANACGLPVITIDHEDNAAAVLIKEKKNGQLTKLSPVGIASAIEDVLSQKIQKKEIIARAKKYDWDKVTLLAERFYQSL